MVAPPASSLVTSKYGGVPVTSVAPLAQAGVVRRSPSSTAHGAPLYVTERRAKFAESACASTPSPSYRRPASVHRHATI